VLLSGCALITVDQTFVRFSDAVQQADLFGDGQTPEPRRGLTGPLNILVARIDDSVSVMHLPQREGRRGRAYLFSLPHDLLVAIPAFPKSGFPGAGAEKLAYAMFFGAQDPRGGVPNPAKGFELLARTVGGLTGIERFDAGVILDLSGAPLVFSGRGVPLHEWAFTLRELKPNNLTLIHLAGHEQLDVEAFSFFDSLLDGSVDNYVLKHPEMISGAV
jgi:hypothetical protein